MKSKESRYHHKKIKGGALQYIVALSLLIFFLMGMFILKAHYSNLHVNEVIISERLIDQLSSAKLLLKHQPSLVNKTGQRELEVLDDKITLKSEHWGVFDLVELESKYRHQSKKEIFMLGDNIWEKERPSLYLADKKRYLSVCGDTWVGGLVYLPPLGVRRSYVDGVGYYREKVIQGEIRKSEQNLPKVNEKHLERFEEQWKLDLDGDSIIAWEEVSEDYLKRSFRKRALVFHSTEEIHLRNMSLKGKIKLISDKAIIIYATSNLEQSILVAPRVIFKKACKVNCQIYAKDFVELGADSRLTYPSIVFMNGLNPKKEFIIKGSSEFHGEIMVLGKKENEMPSVKLNSDAKIKGFLYCDGTIEMEGEVAGSVYTNRFLLKTRSAMYENHLLNNRLDLTDLDSSYAGVVWLSEGTKKEIIEYLW